MSTLNYEPITTTDKIRVNDKIVKYKLTLPNAKKPFLATLGSAGYDVYSCQNVVILPGECKQIDIGLAIEMPEGLVLQLHNRSSIGRKMINLQCGIIDSDYRGPISVYLANYGHEAYASNTYTHITILSCLIIHLFIFLKSRKAIALLKPYFMNTKRLTGLITKSCRKPCVETVVERLF